MLRHSGLGGLPGSRSPRRRAHRSRPGRDAGGATGEAAASTVSAPTARAPERDSRQRAEAGPELLDANERTLFDALRRHRHALARRAGVPPYVIASDRTLREIALLRPRNLEELELAHGNGPAKREKYGAGWLAVVLGGR